jgi:murein DD-endopeptidase MepM/ murein hydrolase activator NlpD
MCETPSPSPAVPSGAKPPPRPRARRTLTALLVLVLVAALHLALPAHALPADPPGGGQGGTVSTQGRWQWPMAAPHEIIGPFVAPSHRYGPGHRGVDIRASGRDVHAVEDGTVRFAGSVAGRGVVSILHADGLASTYEPVEASVHAGDRVTAGQLIGVLGDAGSSGHCEEACLHLGARRGGADYLDPEPLLRGVRPSVLLPLEGAASVLAGIAGAPG